mgnify:CR=1 FL=1
MRVQASKRTITLKIVYYGPGMSGKTTNLVKLHEAYPEGRRGSMIKLATESERTLFFDYFPAALGTIGGFAIKVDFFTVPGQSFYGATRRAVLQGADGVVFVADSDPRRERANLSSKADMLSALEEHGHALDSVALVYQWNKRDLPKVLPLSVLERTLNPEGAPAVESVANKGEGVRETQEIVLRRTLEILRNTSLKGAARAV